MTASQFGIMLPSFDPYRLGKLPLLEAARLTEECGFDSAWVGDHLSFHPPIHEALTSLAAVGAVTERIQLGTNVLLLALRQWPLLASQLGTIDALFPDRLVLGVGVGGEHPPEWEAAGVPVNERGRRVDEGIEVLTELLSGRPVDHTGPKAPVRSPRIAPNPGRMLPLIIGGRSPAAIERTARVGDGWIGVWMDPDDVRRHLELLGERAEAHGRPRPTPMFMIFAMVDDDNARADEQSAALFRGQYNMPYEVVERWTATGSAEQVAEFIGRYREAGVERFVLSPTAPDALDQIERFAGLRELLQ